MITAKNIVRHELIGLKVKVVDSKNKDNIGKEGKVVDETRNTLVVECEDEKQRTFIKDHCVFSFELPSGEKVRVDGSLLVGRPEDRIKKKLKRW
jgi:ribonuclease P protein subunit POP4